MCLGVPGKVVAIDGLSATVDFFGVRKELRLDIVDEPVSVGDYVLNHVGFAIRRIPPEEVQETLALFDQILDVSGAKEDLMAADVRGEIAAAKTRRDAVAPRPMAAHGHVLRSELESSATRCAPARSPRRSRREGGARSAGACR